jgi:hypothetical protein
MKALFILFASSVFASPILDKRYDLDHNDIPDWCFTNEDIVSCLLSEASYVWTTFTTSSTTTQSATVPASTAASTTLAPPTTAASTSPSASSVPTGTLPVLEAFASGNGSKWHISDVGSIFSSTLPTLGWDNGRTSVLNRVPFWNFGDVLSLDGLADGFSTGPACE